MSGTSWLRAERADLAAEQLLDTAGALFAEHGVAAVSMGAVARAAGCSRATLYRYFDNRDALRTAFVHREARRLGALVSAEVAEIDDPGERLVEAMLSSLRLVRADATLSAWFATGDLGATVALAQSSAVIEALVVGLIGGAGSSLDPETHLRARWVVRVLLSLLAQPEPDSATERALLEEFVAPVVARR